MSDVIDCIRAKFSHAVRRRCSNRGCRLKLDGLREHVVLNGDSFSQHDATCDCIIFVVGDTIVIGIVELKSKTVHSEDIGKKLKDSSQTALNILSKCADKNVKYDFYHLLLSKRLDPSEARKIRMEKIGIGGREYDIITNKCGASFSAVLS